MFKKTLLLMLLMTLLAPWAVGQKALPYSYGFEDNDLATDGWTSTGGAINSVAAYNSSSYGYRFSYSISSDVYLTSPILTGGTYGVNVSFYYKAYSSSYLDHFYVGYTTDETVTDPSAFTYGAMVTSSTSWQLYEDALPAGTVRVAIKYDADNYDDGYYLYLDDFSFTAASSCIAPTNALATYTSGTTATVTWEGSAPSYKIDVNGTITSGVSSPYVLNVAPATTYTVKVQADCGSEQSAWVTAGTFTTDCPTSFSIPYTYGFEDESGINCWTIEADNDGLTGVQNNSWASANLGGSYARTGESFFFFLYTDTPPHYLISPLLSGISNGLHVEFWYRQYTNGVETFQVGYSTTDDDPGSFTWDAEVTASTTYQRYSANYPAGTKYVAVKLTSDDQYYLFLDDFVFEESASCLEPTAVTVTNETTSGATVNWTAGGTETEWDIFVTDDATITPDDATTPTVASTSTKPYTLTGLTPATTYYVYVRAICAKPSAWSSPAIFNTECEGMVLPYSYDFQDDELPICWSTINTNTSYTAVGNMAPSSSSTNRVLYFYRGSSTGTLVAVLPEVDSHYSLSDYQITFDACYANGSGGSMTAGKLGIGIMDDPTDFTTFELIEEVDITDGFSTYGSHTVMFNNYTGHGQYIAIQDIHTQNGYVLVDNIEVTELPACIPPTNVAISGGANAVVTWDGSATSYQVAYATDGTVNPDDYIINTDVTATTFDLSSYVALGDNYVWVRSNCGKDHSVWVGDYFDLGYCTPAPSSHDGSGITAVSFGTGAYVVTNGDGSASLPASAPFYGDYTSMIGAVNAGVESTIAITTGTGSYPYTFVIWVDFDNSYTFDDSEILYIGKASSGNGTLNATITVPITQALGDYRMRIYGADSYFSNFYNNGNTDWTAAHDPCNSGTYRHAHDYTLRVLEAPSCMAPTALGADHITTNSADLSWTANSGESAWTIYYKKTSESSYTEEPANANPYTLNGLDAATEYEYYVVANCTSTETSDPSSTFSFTTPCNAIAALGFADDFDTYTGVTSGATNNLPGCWSYINTCTYSSYQGYPVIYNGSSYSASGANSLRFYSYYSSYGSYDPQPQYAILPPMTGLAGLQVTLKARGYNANSTFKIGTMKDPNDASTFTPITEQTGLTTSYQTFDYFIPSTCTDGYLVIMIDAANSSRTANGVYIDDISITTAPTCVKPTDLDAKNITTTSAVLCWTANSGESAWTIYYKKASETTYTEEPANANPYDLTGLDSSTSYEYYVVANCSSTDESEPSAVFSFATECEDITTFPWTENFNSLTVANSIPVCWNNDEGTTTSDSYKWCYNTKTSGTNGAAIGHDGEKCLVFNSYNNSNNNTNFLKTPVISLPSTPDMQLTFWYKNPAGGDFSVYISTDGGTTYTTALATGLTGVSAWTQHDPIILSAYAGQDVVIVFKGTSNYGNGDAYIYLDDVTIEEAPACATPTALGATTAATSANLSWTANSGETEWTIYYKESTETTYIEVPNVTTNPYTLSGLTASTTYDYYVVANCSSTSESTPSVEYTFTTECEPYTITDAAPYTQDFEAPVVTSTYSSSTNLEVPVCWENPYTTGTNQAGKPHITKNGDTYNYSSGQVLNFYGSGNNFVTLPEFTNTLSDLIITFKIATESSSNGTLKLGYITDTDNGTYNTFTEIKSFAASSTYYHSLKEESVVLSSLPAEASLLAFKWECSSQWSCNIDDVEVAICHTLTKTITGYGTNDGGYVLLASPIKNVNPVNANMIDVDGNYDLFSFDQTYATEEWRNYKQGTFNLEPGKGYLYASKSNVTLTFTGALYAGNGKVDLAYDGSQPFAGWNLIGNPYATAATIDQPYYRLNTDGSELNATTESTAVAVMEGVFVQATAADQATFTASSSKGERSNGIPQTNVMIVNGKGLLIDNAIVRFDNGATLDKFQLDETNTKVYIQKDGKDYAVVNAGNEGVIPVNFKAAESGTYTLCFTAENVEFGYLHLIDNMNGNDVDLLATPSYTFDAQFTDYASRFKLVFATTNATDDQFAFISDGQIILSGVNGNTTVQLFDVTGRMLSSTNGVNHLSTENMAAGVYMLRVINGNETRTQKIIVK